MLRTVLIFLAPLVALLPVPALAAHPLVTDDAGTQGAGALQLELTAELLENRPAPGVVDVGGAAAATLSLGASDAVDVVLGLPARWTRSRVDGAFVAEAAGTGDATLDAKWRVLEAGGFSVAVKPGLTFPSGEVRRGLGAGRPGYGLTLIGSQAVGRLALHANAGWHRQDHLLPEDRATQRHETWHASVAAALELGERVQVVANVGAASPGERGATAWPAFALLGAIYAVHDRLDVDVGVRAALNGADADRLVLAGAAWRF